MNIVEKRLDEITPYARNAKQHPQEQVAKIARQIQEVGFLVPIIVDKDGVIVAGHGRLEAAKLLNLETVPVVVAEGLTEAQAMAFRIADNKVAESQWDMPMLAFELGTLERRDVDLTLSGFDMAEARSILASFAGGDPTSSTGADKQGAQDRSGEGDREFAHKCPKCEFEFD